MGGSWPRWVCPLVDREAMAGCPTALVPTASASELEWPPKTAAPTGSSWAQLATQWCHHPSCLHSLAAPHSIMTPCCPCLVRPQFGSCGEEPGQFNSAQFIKLAPDGGVLVRALLGAAYGIFLSTVHPRTGWVSTFFYR